MDSSDDAALLSVLRTFGITPEDKVGQGGEAQVYRVGNDRVLRVLHGGANAEAAWRRRALVEELRQAQPPFALPDVLEIGQEAGRVYVVEQRLPGRSLLETLASATGAGRRRLVEDHLQTAAALGDLFLIPRLSYGDLIGDNPVTTATWRDYLVARGAANLARSTDDLRSIDPAALAADLPEPDGPAFVHLDAFAGNMLTDGNAITAVIDIGPTSVAGDRRLDPLSAAVYLLAPDITPATTADDGDTVRGWLRNAGLDRWFEPSRRWLAGYWSFAVDDPAVLRWCRSVLL
jgi:putative membrane protein